jgi:hypothetical protein
VEVPIEVIKYVEKPV